MTLDFNIDREGPRVILAVRDQSGKGVTIEVHKHAANALAASIVAATSSDDDTSNAFSLRGELTTTEKK